jgi:hypothetical protein
LPISPLLVVVATGVIPEYMIFRSQNIIKHNCSAAKSGGTYTSVATDTLVQGGRNVTVAETQIQ